MPSNHKMIELTRYVGGEDGWICTGSIKASDPTVTVAMIDGELAACDHGPEFSVSWLAMHYGSSIKAVMAERARQEQWLAKRRRYMWAMRQRKLAQS